MSHSAAVAIALQLLERTGVQRWQEPEFRAELIAAALEIENGLCSAGASEMANKVYAVDETAIVFGSEVGDDVAWSNENISSAAGRQSALHDLGAGGTARSERFRYRFQMDGWQATPTVGNTLDLHIKTSDGTDPDNDDGTGDAAVSAEDKLSNLDYLDAIVCDEAAANILAATSGIVHISERHVAFVMWNRGGSATKNDGAGIKLTLTPRPLEIQ